MRGHRVIGLTIAAHVAGCLGEIGVPSAPSGPVASLPPNVPQGPNNPSNPNNPSPSPSPSNPNNPNPSPSPTPMPPVDHCAGVSTPQPGPSPIRRLSNTEWRWALVDLLGAAQASRVHGLADALQVPTESLGFQNNATFLDVQQVLAGQYLDAAETLATAVGRSLVTCNPQMAGEEACALEYAGSLGRRAYRRPLTTEELARFRDLYVEARAHGNFDVAIEWITFAILQSPAFLHRAELGVGRPTGYEMASRLSFFFWHSIPDAALLTAAEQGQLDTPAGVEAAARRLLADPKAHRITRFFDEWLDLDALSTFQRDAAIFPGLDDELASRLMRESETFVSHVLFDPSADGRLSTLLSAPYTFVDAALARHYGLAGVSGDNFRRVELDPAERRGLLTQGGVLSVHDKPSRTSIVRRGLKIRTDVLCQTISSPPDDVELDLPPVEPGLTQKQRLEQHRTNQSCANCHNMMDPIGVAFEKFDAVGRLRAVDEAGTPIDTNSQLEYTRDADGAVSGASELATRLASSEQVADCFVTQLFRYAYARGETAADACTQQRLEQAFEASGGDIRELLVAITQTDAFLYRQ